MFFSTLDSIVLNTILRAGFSFSGCAHTYRAAHMLIVGGVELLCLWYPQLTIAVHEPSPEITCGFTADLFGAAEIK